ncbi:hypothetical protein C8R43DRAFT_1041227 [Mycena crocata]|nr:hypothetical protein C8R43DRAFT_1041227 [Mycena crocata]
MSCRNCGRNDQSETRYLLSCASCGRSWHHRCIDPPIPDVELAKLLQAFFMTSEQRGLDWTCPKCSRKAKLNAGLDISTPLPQTRHTSKSSQNTTSEIIDLTESPAVRRPSGQVPSPLPTSSTSVDNKTGFIDLTSVPNSEPQRSQKNVTHHKSLAKPKRIQETVTEFPQPLAPVPSTEADNATAEVIDLSFHSEVIDLSLDSPPSTVLKLGPDPPTYGSPNFPKIPEAVVDVMDVDTVAASRERSICRSPHLSALTLPPTPIGPPRLSTNTPTTPIKMDVDEQKPLALLLENLTLTGKGGSLGPAWMRERYEISGYMPRLRRSVEAQKRSKPVSRRKPEKTQFRVGDGREEFVLISRVGNSLPTA